MTPENVVSKRKNACASLRKRLLIQRQDYTALADTLMQLAKIFESDNAFLEGLSAAGFNDVALKERRPIRLEAA